MGACRLVANYFEERNAEFRLDTHDDGVNLGLVGRSNMYLLADGGPVDDTDQDPGLVHRCRNWRGNQVDLWGRRFGGIAAGQVHS